MRQSIRRIKTARNRYDKYCSILSTQKRRIPFREMTPEKLKGMLRLYSKMEADAREHAKKDNSGGRDSCDGGITWQESKLTITDIANLCAKAVKGLQRELSRRANQGKQRVKS